MTTSTTPLPRATAVSADRTGVPEALAQAIELDRARSARLPRQLVWLYLLSPILSAPIMTNDIRTIPLGTLAHLIAANYLPFTAIPAACHAVYASRLPVRIAHLRSAAARLAVHAVLATLIALVVGVAIKPLMNVVCLKVVSMFSWLSSCVVITNMFILPTQLMQDLRARARGIELRMQIERQAATEAQLAALQSRANPHFLFNSINTVASLIPEDPVLAERSLERLADILRFSLQSSEHRTVPLHRELAIIRDYLELQVARFGDRLRWTIVADPAADELPVPPLTLQPVVENAVLHGVSRRAEGGSLRIATRATDTQLVLEVSDDGPGPAGSEHRGTGTGMRDLRARLALMYGDAAQIETGASGDRGFHVVIRLPRG